MTRDDVLARIKPHEGELRAAGIRALYLFGSVARNEARADSDIDLACELASDLPIGMIAFIGMQQTLETLLGAPVDLVEDGCLVPLVAKQAMSDRVRIF